MYRITTQHDVFGEMVYYTIHESSALTAALLGDKVEFIPDGL